MWQLLRRLRRWLRSLRMLPPLLPMPSLLLRWRLRRLLRRRLLPPKGTVLRWPVVDGSVCTRHLIDHPPVLRELFRVLLWAGCGTDGQPAPVLNLSHAVCGALVRKVVD